MGDGDGFQGRDDAHRDAIGGVRGVDSDEVAGADNGERGVDFDVNFREGRIGFSFVVRVRVILGCNVDIEAARVEMGGWETRDMALGVLVCWRTTWNVGVNVETETETLEVSWLR